VTSSTPRRSPRSIGQILPRKSQSISAQPLRARTARL
jgi:hypothetical protein